MNHTAKFFIILLLWIPLSVYADGAFIFCDKDINDTSHPFHRNNLQDLIPEDLKPGEAKDVYTQFLSRYESQLTEQQASMPLVKKFIALQKEILAGTKSANLGFSRDEDDNSIEILSSGSKDIMDVPCRDSDEDYLKDIAFLVVAYRNVHNGSWSVIRDATTRQIQFLEQQYYEWYKNGLPMWPLETYVNGKFLDESDAVKPKKWQLVVLRPSIGLGLNTHNAFGESKAEATLGIEPIGYLKYTKDNYSAYWGVSLLVTGGDDVGFGYGVLARYNNYVLGITRREDNEKYGVSNNDAYLFIGVDLYKMIHEKEDRFREFKQKVNANIKKHLPNL